MKIAFFSDNFYPELSGIVDSILITGKELERRGHEVCYVGPRYTEREYKLVNRNAPTSVADDQVNGLPFVRLPSVPLPYSPTGQSRFAFPTGASFAYLDKFKPDIIHTQSPYGTGFEAMRAAKRYQVPLVGTNHTDVAEFYPFAPNVMRRFDAWYYNHCAEITTPYQLLIDRMREKGFRKPARVMPNPVELPLYYPLPPAEKAALKKRLGFSGQVALYCGRLAVEKRVDQVLEGVAQIAAGHPELMFVATGHGAEEKKLRALAKKLGLESRVHFTGFLAHETLPEYYQAADVFTLMSTSDSQSLALMQAFAVGIPAIGARSKGLPDYLRPDCGFLVEPGDVGGFAKHLDMLLTDAALQTKMGAAGLEFVKRFAPQQIAETWEVIYQKAIAR